MKSLSQVNLHFLKLGPLLNFPKAPVEVQPSRDRRVFNLNSADS